MSLSAREFQASSTALLISAGYAKFISLTDANRSPSPTSNPANVVRSMNSDILREIFGHSSLRTEVSSSAVVSSIAAIVVVGLV